MKKIFIFLLLIASMNSFAQTYEDSSVEYESPEVYTQEPEESPYLEPIDYPEEYISEQTDYEHESEYYEEP